MTTKAHNDEVARLKFQGFETHGFRASIKRKLKSLGSDHDGTDEWVGIVPDGYKWIEDAAREGLWRWSVVVAEVENQSLIRKKRLDQWALVWFFLDCECIDMKLKVITVGREPQMIDMENYYYENCNSFGTEAE